MSEPGTASTAPALVNPGERIDMSERRRCPGSGSEIDGRGHHAIDAIDGRPTCPVCGRRYRVTKEGFIHAHTWRGR
jgi:hypothetical protein